MEKKDFRILVADDDDIALDVVGTLLRREGYTVIPAKDGDEAVRNISQGGIGLVITDLKMPVHDGIEVLRSAVAYDPEIAVVILTAYGTLDTALEAMKHGAYDYLTKPFHAQEIAFVADRAYKRAILISEQRLLKGILRDTYLDLAEMECWTDDLDPSRRSAWLERIKNLEALAVLNSDEAAQLKERLVGSYGEGQYPHNRR